MIHEAELVRSLAWGDYLRSHSNRFCAVAVIPETTDAMTVLAKIQDGKLADTDGVIPDSFTPRQVLVDTMQKLQRCAGFTTETPKALV